VISIITIINQERSDLFFGIPNFGSSRGLPGKSEARRLVANGFRGACFAEATGKSGFLAEKLPRADRRYLAVNPPGGPVDPE